MFTSSLRRKFLEYFKNKGHALIASSPVVPYEDPTLLFTNAGMNQFKDVFLGKSEREYKRAATSQKCIRVGGKHNDLENVGHTTRHLTFFEMLGNFSFGDYFKKDAIDFAWEVATEVFEFEPEKIWPTVFLDDDESFELWTKYVPANRISRLGEKDNFWSMGDTGPCGPCSELYYDRGDAFGKASSVLEDLEGERFLEFWNLVFMQYNRLADGMLMPLPKPSIDTGAGLERVVSLKMGVNSLFETDVLRSLIARVEEISHIPYDPCDPQRGPAFCVIADHLRCLSFAIADGVQPSNVDRGYVLRKILRRAVRYGRMLGMEDPFLAKILPKLTELMGQDYPELRKSEHRIAEILTLEEESFIKTLKRGGNLLNSIVEKSKAENKIISGDDAFKLKDTYGFPLEEIMLLAKDAGLHVDISRYHQLESEAKERSRSVHKVTQQIASENLYSQIIEKHGVTTFIGYNNASSPAKIIALLSNGQFVEELTEGQEGSIILDTSPFYAEMGGQIGDTGSISGSSLLFSVSDCQSPFKGIVSHIGQIQKGSASIGQEVFASIDSDRRQKIANNHTATHLLHWALHKILGEHVKQTGSVVEPTRLRFDFSHHKPLTKDEIFEIEDLVNNKIRENTPVKSYELPYEQAQKREDIKQFFGEKYGRTVRVIDIEQSKELCGGTHIKSLGEIGCFRIAKESSIAAGVRRIEAVTGREAEELARQDAITILQLAESLKAQPNQLSDRVEKLLEENKQLLTEVKSLKKSQLLTLSKGYLEKIESINSLSFLGLELSLSPEEMRLLADELMSKMGSGILVLGSTFEDKCQILIRVSEDVIAKNVKASDLIKLAAPVIEGTGGGKNQQAQAGGKAAHMLPEALSVIKKHLEGLC